MNDVIEYPVNLRIGKLVVGIAAAIGATHPAWPTRAATSFTLDHSSPSYSTFERSLVFAIAPDNTEFAKIINGIYGELAGAQEPLGAEFEDIWDRHAADLYES